MFSIEPAPGRFSATIRGIDAAEPLSMEQVRGIVDALGEYGVICLPDQRLTPEQQQRFAENFGIPQPSNEWNIAGAPMVSVLSNVVIDGRNTGYVDAGMSWHKDMTYLAKPGFLTMLYAVNVPRRDGRSLGATHFANARAAFDELSDDLKRRLQNAVGVNSAEYYNTRIIREGSVREAFAKKPRKRAPSLHPIVYVHPFSGHTVLYCDPGHVESIDGFAPEDSDEMVSFLRDHQLQPKYRHAHQWTEGDLLIWDNLSTLHKATLDYSADEPRRMHRCMVAQPDDFSTPRLL